MLEGMSRILDLRQRISTNRPELGWGFLVLLSSILLSAFTVYDQVFHRVGLQYICDEQLRFHRWVIEGTSIDPWQYRIFVPYLIESCRDFFELVGGAFSYGRIFFGLRLFQNFLIFLFFSRYISELKIKRGVILLGLAILAWGFTYSGYGSGLAFDTYFDLIFYLLAGLAILNRRPLQILPISILAALNRETGILIPFLLLVSNFQFPLKQFIKKREFYIGVISLLLFVVILSTIRIAYGPRPFLREYPPGFSLLMFNLTHFYSYFSAIATYSIIPLVALVQFKKWPSILRHFFWVMVPVWILVHAFTSIVAEARLFLVPYVLILLPAALIVSQNTTSQDGPSLDYQELR